MCNDSSIIFTQKCSHLYSNLELFLFCLYFFPALLLSFFVPTSTKPTATLRGDQNVWFPSQSEQSLMFKKKIPPKMAMMGAAGGHTRCIYDTGCAVGK